MHSVATISPFFDYVYLDYIFFQMSFYPGFIITYLGLYFLCLFHFPSKSFLLYFTNALVDKLEVFLLKGKGQLHGQLEEH